MTRAYAGVQGYTRVRMEWDRCPIKAVYAVKIWSLSVAINTSVSGGFL